MSRFLRVTPRVLSVALGFVISGQLAVSPARSQDMDDELDLDSEDEATQTLEAGSQGKTPTEELKQNSMPIAQPQSPSQSSAGSSGRNEGLSEVVFDAPDTELEKRFGILGDRYPRLSEEKWESILGARRSESYAVQRGDTLWDISQTFFGDGFFWAKIWSQNGAIENPHQLLSGKLIKFTAGTEADAPSIGVMDTLVASADSKGIFSEHLGEAPVYLDSGNDAERVSDANGSLESDELLPPPELPPAAKRQPTLKDLPNSFAGSEETSPRSYNSQGLDMSGLIRVQTPSANVFVNSLIFDRRPEVIGSVQEIETAERMAVVGQAVFIKMAREARLGERLTIVNIKGRVGRRGDFHGPVVAMAGVAQIEQLIDQRRNVYRATLLMTESPVQPGFSVISEPPVKASYLREGRAATNIDVRVIGGEFDERRKILGAGSVVYLDGGKSAGLEVGMILGVGSRRAERRKTLFANFEKPIGVLKVVDVRSSVATAIVLESFEEIRVGDRTGDRLPESLRYLSLDPADKSQN